VDVQALGKVDAISGGDAELSVDGDMSAAASGFLDLHAAALTGTVAGSAAVTAGGGLRAATDGAASLGSESLAANVRGDVRVTGRGLELAGTEKMSVVASDIDVQSPGAVRVQGNSGFADLSDDAVWVASASGLEATAAGGMLLNADTVQLGAASSLDVSSVDSARVISRDVKVLAADELAAAAAAAKLSVHGNIDAFSGGDVAGSFGTVAAELRNDLSLVSSGDASLSGDAAAVSVSGSLEATADEVTLATAALDVATGDLSAAAAESASLTTVDVDLSASSEMSAYVGSADVLVEGSLSLQSQGSAQLRSTGRVEMESMDVTKLRTRNTLATATDKLRVRAGAPQDGGRVRVALDCDQLEEGCAAIQQDSDMFLSEAAELLGVPIERLRVSVPEAQAQTGRRQMRTAGEGRQPRSHRRRRRELRKWSVKEVEKWAGGVLGMRNVAQSVSRERVDGLLAIGMTAEDWEEIGATTSQAAKLTMAVKQLL